MSRSPRFTPEYFLSVLTDTKLHFENKISKTELREKYKSINLLLKYFASKNILKAKTKRGKYEWIYGEPSIELAIKLHQEFYKTEIFDGVEISSRPSVKLEFEKISQLNDYLYTNYSDEFRIFSILEITNKFNVPKFYFTYYKQQKILIQDKKNPLKFKWVAENPSVEFNKKIQSAFVIYRFYTRNKDKVKSPISRKIITKRETYHYTPEYFLKLLIDLKKVIENDKLIISLESQHPNIKNFRAFFSNKKIIVYKRGFNRRLFEWNYDEPTIEKATILLDEFHVFRNNKKNQKSSLP